MQHALGLTSFVDAEFVATVGQMASQHAPLLRHMRSVEAALRIVKTNTVRLQTENCKLANTTQQKQAVAGSSASEASCAASTPDTSGSVCVDVVLVPCICC